MNIKKLFVGLLVGLRLQRPNNESTFAANVRHPIDPHLQPDSSNTPVNLKARSWFHRIQNRWQSTKTAQKSTVSLQAINLAEPLIPEFKRTTSSFASEEMMPATSLPWLIDSLPEQHNAHDEIHIEKLDVQESPMVEERISAVQVSTVADDVRSSSEREDQLAERKRQQFAAMLQKGTALSIKRGDATVNIELENANDHLGGFCINALIRKNLLTVENDGSFYVPVNTNMQNTRDLAQEYISDLLGKLENATALKVYDEMFDLTDPSNHDIVQKLVDERLAESDANGKITQFSELNKRRAQSYIASWLPSRKPPSKVVDVEMDLVVGNGIEKPVVSQAAIKLEVLDTAINEVANKLVNAELSKAIEELKIEAATEQEAANKAINKVADVVSNTALLDAIGELKVEVAKELEATNRAVNKVADVVSNTALFDAIGELEGEAVKEREETNKSTYEAPASIEAVHDTIPSEIEISLQAADVIAPVEIEEIAKKVEIPIARINEQALDVALKVIVEPDVDLVPAEENEKVPDSSLSEKTVVDSEIIAINHEEKERFKIPLVNSNASTLALIKKIDQAVLIKHQFSRNPETKLALQAHIGKKIEQSGVGYFLPMMAVSLQQKPIDNMNYMRQRSLQWVVKNLNAVHAENKRKEIELQAAESAKVQEERLKAALFENMLKGTQWG